jgi:phenolphthiocerol/phthiocerol/phthiodiolone dimycocerosyl transferase
LERFLAPHEAAIAAAGVRVVLCGDVDGELDEAALARALAALRGCYPLLAGRIISRDGRSLVEIGDRPAELVLHRGADFDEEINAPLTWERGPLVRLALVREPGRTRVVMTLPRAFVDGMSYLAVHDRLWAIYTALRKKEPVPDGLVRPALGPALDDLLASRFSPQRLRDFVEERARLDAVSPPALLPALASADGGPGAEMSFRIIRVQTDAARSARLARRARDATLTLNALVSGVLLTSLRSLLLPESGPLRLLCTTAVDMRRRLTPPIPPEVLQSAATTTSIRLRVDPAAHPAEVGHDLSRQLRADLDSGAAAMELAAFPYMIDQHPPSLVITNVGAIAEPALAGGLQIAHVQLAPLGHLPMIFAVVSTYRQRLAVDLTYSRAWFTDTQIHDLAARTSATLDDLTA